MHPARTSKTAGTQRMLCGVTADVKVLRPNHENLVVQVGDAPGPDF